MKSSENAIELKNLSKYFKVYKKQPGFVGSLKGLFKREYNTVKAVDDVSFDIKQGELVGFIGPNGAGKTTTLKMCSGLLYPTAGSVEVLGFTPFKRKPEYLKQISLIMGQKNQLWWDLPAIETFELNRQIYDIPKDEYQKTLDDLVDMLEVREILNQQVRKLSLGQRMKCELIAALLHRPKVLFLDEPTIGLDIVMQKRIRKFIKEYNQKYNATVILTSHYMDDVKEICDRVIIINKGRLVYDGGIAELIKKHADYKILTVITNGKILKKDVEKYGDVAKIDEHRFTLNVKRSDVSKVAGDVLKAFDVDDLDINEPKLEDIVEGIFSRD
ncbi:ATP-binding cassette domain-containing protein [Candidatus Dojkabacteria bacterium]|nr:ATP-binding cassette domain-containing protein [Candidatus Dojkabacteria bacterium]